MNLTSPILQNVSRPTILQTLIEFNQLSASDYREILRDQGITPQVGATSEQIKSLAKVYAIRFHYEAYHQSSPRELMSEFRAALAACGGDR